VLNNESVAGFLICCVRIFFSACALVIAVGATCENSYFQGNVAKRLRCGGIFSDRFIANFLLSVSVKKF